MLKEDDKENIRKIFYCTLKPVGMADLEGSTTYTNLALRDLLGIKEIIGRLVKIL